jgi:hypothetical protein
MMKRQLVTFARDVDAFCARLNDGLTVIAILLGFLVMTVSVLRAQDAMPNLAAAVPMDYPLPAGQ